MHAYAHCRTHKLHACCVQEQEAVQQLLQLKQQLGVSQEQHQHAKGLPKTPQGRLDYQEDFFGKPTFLTVSGQLNAEIYATALSDVYTFGETPCCGLSICISHRAAEC